MKVLHVIPSVSPLRGGPSQAVLEMVQALRDTDVDAEIATTNDHGTERLDVPLQQLIQYQHVPIRFFPRFSPDLPAVREFAFSLELTDWLWHHIQDYALVHVHAIFSYPSTIAMAIARQHRVPYINHPLGQLCQWSLQQGAPKKQVYLRLIERTNLNHSQALHFTSLQEQSEAGRLGLKVPGMVLPHGLVVPFPKPHARQRLRQYLNLPADEPIILWASRFCAKSGLDYLIPALGKLTHQRFTFVLAGDGAWEYRTEVSDLLMTHGLQDRTCRPGLIEGELKNLFMQGADLFALTSHTETRGTALLEALAAGLPVLTTSGVALAGRVADQQLGMLAELNVEAIAAAMDRLLSQPEQLHEMGDRARRFVLANYNWSQVATRLHQAYTIILQRQAMPGLIPN